MDKIPVGSAIRESFAFFRPAWRRVWGAMMILVWVTAMSQMIQALRPEWTLAGLLALIALVAAGTAAAGALYRMGLEAEHAGDPAFRLGLGGVQWGGVEWRVLIANIVVGLILGVLFIVLFLLCAFVLGVAAAVTGHAGDVQALEGAQGSAAQFDGLVHLLFGPAGFISLIALIPSAAALLYVGARLLLMPIASADLGRFDFGQAWTLARGAILAIIVAALVIGLAQIVAEVVAGFIAGVIGGIVNGGPEGAKLWGAVVGPAIGAAVNAPLVAGLQIYIYKARRGGGSAVATTFA